MILAKISPILLLSVLLTGCTTVTSYERKAEHGAARPKEYPIYLYPEKVAVPRPYDVVGVITIRDTPLTVFGGSLEGELDEVRAKARKVGADGARLLSVEEPDFLHPKYRVSAELIRFKDKWESVSLSENEFRDYLQSNRATLNPIEGIWTATDAMQSRVGIIKSGFPKGRDFVTFLLGSSNPTWQRGDKKMDLARGERPGVYRGVFYLDDYQRQGVAFNLLGRQTNTFFFRLSDDTPPIIFTKE